MLAAALALGISITSTTAPAPATPPPVPTAASTPSTLHGSGSISHLASKVTAMGSIVLPDGTTVDGTVLAAAMRESGVLKDGDKYVPAAAVPHNGCPGDSIGRGAGYLFNAANKTNAGTAGSFDATTLALTILEMLFPSGMSPGQAAYTDPALWKAKKDGLVGSWIDTKVLPFPGDGDAGAKFFIDFTKDLGAGVVNELVIDLKDASSSACTVDGHVALGYRTLAFDGYPDIIAVTIADDYKQGDDFAQTYERGPFIIDRRTGKILSGAFRGGKITHAIRESRKPVTTRDDYRRTASTDDTAIIRAWKAKNVRSSGSPSH